MKRINNPSYEKMMARNVFTHVPVTIKQKNGKKLSGLLYFYGNNFIVLLQEIQNAKGKTSTKYTNMPFNMISYLSYKPVEISLLDWINEDDEVVLHLIDSIVKESLIKK